MGRGRGRRTFPVWGWHFSCVTSPQATTDGEDADKEGSQRSAEAVGVSAPIASSRSSILHPGGSRCSLLSHTGTHSVFSHLPHSWVPAGPFHPHVLTAGIASSGVKTAHPQPKGLKSQTKSQSSAAENKFHLTGSRAQEMLISAMGWIRSLGGTGRGEACAPNTAN